MPQTKSRSSKDQVFRVKGAVKQLPRQFLPLLSAINSPRSLTVWLLLKHGEWDQLVSLDINPNDYSDPRAFALDYQATKVFSKMSDLPCSFEREKLALEKWIAAEDSCQRTNSMLARYRSGEETPPPRLASILHLAQRKVSSILGYLDLDFVIRESRWGPGATSAVTGNDTSSEAKFSARADVSPYCLSYALLLRKAIPSWQPKDYHLVDYNKLLFVPKSSKIDRAICVEPHINSFLQLGVGSLIRRRLLRVGIDLNRGQALHRSLVLDASKDDGFATIDLSSASDTISSGLVFDLLPESWFTLLDELRSPRTKLPDGSFRTLEKFSSMGNGFTFELETLLFYAILSAIADLIGCANPIYVYGDDIICSKAVAREFMVWIGDLGFSVNTEKSFVSGPFRESCGCDAFLGYDVRPFFLKEIPYDQTRLYRLANGIRKAAARIHSIECGQPLRVPIRPDYIPRTREFGCLLDILPPAPPTPVLCSRTYYGWWEAVVHTLPESRRYFVPEGFSDESGLHSDPCEMSEVVYLGAMAIKKRIAEDSPGLGPYALYLNRDKEYVGSPVGNSVTLRNRVRYGRKRKKISFANFFYGGWA